MESLYQTESFLTACISLVHEPDKPWSSQWPSCTNSRKELRRCCSPIGHNHTKHVLCPIRSQYSLDRLEMVPWESVPRGSSARAWKLSSRLSSALGLRGCHLTGSKSIQIPFFGLASHVNKMVKKVSWPKQRQSRIQPNSRRCRIIVSSGVVVSALASHQFARSGFT